jgi:plasmid stabilization system protein ParE
MQETDMRTTLIASTLAASLAAGAAFAAEPAIGTRLGTDLTEIAAALSAESYDVTRYEASASRIEVSAVRADSRIDIVLDPATGNVVALAAGGRFGAPGRPGVDDEAVRAMLASEGYAITKYERERGEIEVYATKDGKTWEIEVDPLTGRIVKVEEEA